ncbi:MAG: hypothetical protein RLO52_24190 [Sandaracinaceae bacterium]
MRSWWVSGDVPLQLTVGISVGADVASVPHTVRTVAIVNGRVTRVRRTEGAWEEVLATSQSSGVASFVSTIEIERTNFDEGLNSLSLLYIIETPTSVPSTWSGAFPSVNVFIDRTGSNPLATDNSTLELTTRTRLPRQSSFVSLGEEGPMVAYLRDPDLLEPNGLWIHVQSSDDVANCGSDNGVAIVALLDGQLLPIGPEGATSTLVSVGPTERLAFRLPTLDLPSDSGHSLLLLAVGGVGHPFEADEGWLSPWGLFWTNLLLLEW